MKNYINKNTLLTTFATIISLVSVESKAFEVDWKLYEKNKQIKNTIDKTLNYIMENEGFSSVVFMDGKKQAIGFGDNYLKKEYPNLKTISPEVAKFRAKKHIMRDFLSIHKDIDKGQTRSYFYALTQKQQISILDLVYNVGITSYQKNQIRPMIKRLIRGKKVYCKDFEMAFLQPNYTHQKGKLLSGLVKRRVENLNMFFEDTNCPLLNYEKVLLKIKSNKMKFR